MDINADTITAYFKDNGASEKCPFCGHEDWGIPADKAEKADTMSAYYATITLMQNGEPIDSAMPVIPFGCLTCGFVRLQSMYHLQAWISSKSNQNEASN